jgi:hypothetical protein
MGLYALLRIVQGPQADRWALLAGMACACVFWCRLPVGLTTTAGLVSVWLGLHLAHWEPAGLSKRRVLAWLAGGFGAVHAVIFGHLLFTGAVREWWLQNVLWPSRWHGTVPLTWEKIFTTYLRPDSGLLLALLLAAVALPFLIRRSGRLLPTWLTVVYFALIAGVAAWQHERFYFIVALRSGGWTTLLPVAVFAQVTLSLGLVMRGKHPRTPEFWLVSALALSSAAALPQFYPLPDPWHVLWAMAPAFGLGLYLGWRWLGWPAWACATAVCIALIPAIDVKRRAAAHALSLPRVTITKPSVLRGMQVDADLAADLRRIAEAIDVVQKFDPNVASSLIGIDAMYLCFPNNRINVTPYYVTWPMLASQQAEVTRWEHIRRDRPMLLIHGARWDVINELYRGSHYVPLTYVPGLAFELAVPQELAEALGLKVYGLDKPAPATTAP